MEPWWSEAAAGRLTGVDFRHEAVSHPSSRRFVSNLFLLWSPTYPYLMLQAINHDGGLISGGGNGNFATAPIHHTEPGSGFGLQSDYQTNYGRETPPHDINGGFGGGQLDNYNAYQPPPPPPPSAGGYVGPSSSLSGVGGGYRFVPLRRYLRQ